MIHISEIVRGNFCSAYLGYYAFTPHNGHGLHEARACARVLDDAFSRHQLHRLEANIQPGNVASKELVQRSGLPARRIFTAVSEDWGTLARPRALGDYGGGMEDVAAGATTVIRAIFFDLDGTLYDRDAAIVSLAELQFEAFRNDFSDLTHSLSLSNAWSPWTATGTAARRALSPSTGQRAWIPGYRWRSVSKRTFVPAIRSCCRVTEDTLTTLETLRRRSLKLGLITNGPADWQSLQDRSDGYCSAVRHGSHFRK